MKFLNGLVFGVIIGAAAYWFIEYKAREHPEAQKSYEQSAAQAMTDAGTAARHFANAMQAKLETLDLKPDEIRDEMARTGKVVRHKALEIKDEVADAATDTRIVAEIKTKYAKDPDLSVWAISVSCKDGHVELSGTVPTEDGVGKAIALAMEAKGVQDVTSTLVVKPKE